MSLQQRNAIKHSVEPMVQPVLDSIPSFNWTKFQEKHGISMPDMFKKDEKPRPGIKLRELGYKPKHPIIIVPGFVTSGLELWHGKPCASKYFRCESLPQVAVLAAGAKPVPGLQEGAKHCHTMSPVACSSGMASSAQAHIRCAS